MIAKEIDRIEAADVEAVVDNGVPEGRTIEYKATLPGPLDDDKREFLADVSSFANAAGGDILYGVTGQRDAKGKATGLPEAAVGLAGANVDADSLRLEDVLRNGVDPRIPGVRFRFIEGFKQGPILLVRVPQSWAAPHMVTFKNRNTSPVCNDPL